MARQRYLAQLRRGRRAGWPATTTVSSSCSPSRCLAPELCHGMHTTAACQPSPLNNTSSCPSQALLARLPIMSAQVAHPPQTRHVSAGQQPTCPACQQPHSETLHTARGSWHKCSGCAPQHWMQAALKNHEPAARSAGSASMCSALSAAMAAGSSGPAPLCALQASGRSNLQVRARVAALRVHARLSAAATFGCAAAALWI